MAAGVGVGENMGGDSVCWVIHEFLEKEESSGLELATQRAGALYTVMLP